MICGVVEVTTGIVGGGVGSYFSRAACDSTATVAHQKTVPLTSYFW